MKYLFSIEISLSQLYPGALLLKGLEPGTGLLGGSNTFSDCFGCSEKESLGLTYLSGLMSSIQRKIAESIALEIKTPQKVRLTQHFLKTYQWDHEAMLQQHQQFVGQAIATKDGMLTVDYSEIPKKGKQSVGVAPQYCGNTGKRDNCQSGVFIGYVSEKGHGLIDTQL